MSVADGTTRGFSGARVFENTVGAIKRNLTAFGIFSLVLFALPGGVLQLLLQPFRQLGAGAAVSPEQYGQYGAISLVGLIGLVCSLIAYAGLIWGYWADMSGRRPTFEAMLKAGLGAAWPVLLTSICLIVGVSAGLFLLIVPGVMLAVLWCVAIPAQVVEKPGVFGALRRSADLTRGYRWAIFGLGLLYCVAVVIISALVGMIIGMLGFAGAGTGLDALGFVAILLSALFNAVYGVVGVVFGAALYYELRAIKDGLAPETLGKVFE